MATLRIPQAQAFHITTNTTININLPGSGPSGDIGVASILINCTNAGSAWTLALTDQGGTPKTFFSGTLTVNGTAPFQMFSSDYGLLASGGLKIVTAGTTPGVVDVFITFGASAIASG